jgi:hypothetical protein
MKLLLGVFVLAATPLFAFDDATPVPAAAGKIYECTDADGQVVYQDEPCLEAAPPRAVPKPAKASKSSTASRPQKAPKPPKARLKADPKPEAGALPWVPVPSRPAPRRFELPSSGGPVDARWATPETSLQTFVAAVKAGDGALVLSCLTSEALAELGPDLSELPLERLQKTVGSFTGYVTEGDVGPFWSIRALRAGMRPKWIFFERTGNGEWKIGWI